MTQGNRRFSLVSLASTIAIKEEVGCFWSSEGFSQVIPHRGGEPALFCSYSAASLTAQVIVYRSGRRLTAEWPEEKVTEGVDPRDQAFDE